MRDALSRSYYAVFHAGCVLIGKGFGNHSGFLTELRGVLGDDADGQSVIDKVEEIRNLRIQADYISDAVERFYGGKLDKFRDAAVNGLKLGQEVYGVLVNRIAAKNERAES